MRSKKSVLKEKARTVREIGNKFFTYFERGGVSVIFGGFDSKRQILPAILPEKAVLFNTEEEAREAVKSLPMDWKISTIKADLSIIITATITEQAQSRFNRDMREHPYGADEFERYIAEAGWQSWMQDYTGATDGEELTEREILNIEEVQRKMWNAHFARQ